METNLLLKALFSLGIVFLLLYLILKILQKYTKYGISLKGRGAKANLKIENILYVDESDKIIILRYKDENDYILAIGKNNLLLIDKIKIDKEDQ